MKIRVNIFPLLRWILAAVFIVSGAEKLLSPIENFIYTIQGYELIHHPDLVEAIALVFPWIELFIGVFLVFGLWTKLALIGSGMMGAGFVVFVGQAMTRNLPITNCGCFGDLVQWPLWVTFALDWTILVLSVLLYLNIKMTNRFSLDHRLD